MRLLSSFSLGKDALKVETLAIYENKRAFLAPLVSANDFIIKKIGTNRGPIFKVVFIIKNPYFFQSQIRMVFQPGVFAKAVFSMKFGSFSLQSPLCCIILFFKYYFVSHMYTKLQSSLKMLYRVLVNRGDKLQGVVLHME